MRAKHDTSMILNSNWIIPGLSLVKKICLCQEADTRDCFFDTRNSPFLADFVCRSRILVCRASTQTKIFLFVSHLCPAKGTKKTVFSFFRINYLFCHVCVAAKDRPKRKDFILPISHIAVMILARGVTHELRLGCHVHAMRYKIGTCIVESWHACQKLSDKALS